MRLGFALCVAVSLLMGADAPKKVDPLQGVWELSGGERDGKPLPDKELKGKLILKGSEYSFTPGGGEKVTGTQKLNSKADPKTIDIVDTTGPHKGKTCLGLYEVQDDNTFRCVFAPTGKPRPTKFETQPDSGQWLHVWKRAKE